MTEPISMSSDDSSAPHASTAHPVVLQLVPHLRAGPEARAAIERALFLKAAGGRPVVVSAGGPLVHELERVGIVHIELDLEHPTLFNFQPQVKILREIIRAHTVDLVHALGVGPAWRAFFAARLERVPFISSLDTPLDNNTRRRRFYHSVLARGDRVIAVSGFMASYGMHAYGMSAGRLRVIPRGVDLFRFNPDHVSPERMATLTQSWRLPDGLKVILCPGPLRRGKGQDLLLRALASLPRRDFICVLTGREEDSPGYAAEVEQIALDLNLEGHVTMVGEVNDPPTACMLADVVVMPALVPEGFGAAAFEAQALGRPVIASDLGALGESFLPGETGWLVTPNNEPILASTLNEALDLTPEQRLRIANRAVAHVHGAYSKEQLGWALLDVYAELYEGHAPWLLSPQA